jgi:hypothetical protein
MRVLNMYYPLILGIASGHGRKNSAKDYWGRRAERVLKNVARTKNKFITDCKSRSVR